MHRMFCSDLIADIIVPRAVGGGDGAIVLLDPALHFGEQLGLQGLRALEHIGGVGVLSDEMLADIGAKHFGVAQHLLPVLVLHPGIVINSGAAKLGNGFGVTAGGGGLWGHGSFTSLTSA